MIRIDELSYRYPTGDFRLQIPGLNIEPTESVAVIGPSGSGKTTLLRLIAGIVQPQEGKVVIAGKDLTQMTDQLRRAFRIKNIGLVFQEFELLEYLSVLDNILLPFRIHRELALTKASRDRARELAGRLGLKGKLGRLPQNLSQGERQRLAVCRAMVTRPVLLLADEPTGNLDPGNKNEVIESLMTCAATDSATLVTVTHDHELLGRYQRVIDFKQFENPIKEAVAQE